MTILESNHGYARLALLIAIIAIGLQYVPSDLIHLEKARPPSTVESWTDEGSSLWNRITGGEKEVVEEIYTDSVYPLPWLQLATSFAALWLGLMAWGSEQSKILSGLALLGACLALGWVQPWAGLAIAALVLIAMSFEQMLRNSLIVPALILIAFALLAIVAWGYTVDALLLAAVPVVVLAMFSAIQVLFARNQS